VPAAELSNPVLYVGLMSGTSLDGVDGVLVDIDAAGGLTLRGHRHEAFVGALRDELLALNTSGSDELHRVALAAQGVARTYASVVNALLFDSGAVARDVRAIGAHGQTVRHRPEAGYTTQLLNGALLAELTGIDVVCDLRSRDVAAGGQGAPLAPGFHASVFGHASETRAVLNLGGISNLTLLAPGRPVIGFDCGPANALLDGWCQRHLQQPFDADGLWAASGRVMQPLLAALLAEPYFDLPPPKSTGRDLFNMAWLDTQVAGVAAADVQATLAALTVESVARDLERHAPQTSALFVCGGGARNAHLMRSFAQRLPRVRIGTTDELGVPVDQVEGAAFAWLAQRFVERQPGNLAEVTGARGPRLLGALYPAQ
jgi:anhydro-N-acetylmuramic acid kinase